MNEGKKKAPLVLVALRALKVSVSSDVAASCRLPGPCLPLQSAEVFGSRFTTAERQIHVLHPASTIQPIHGQGALVVQHQLPEGEATDISVLVSVPDEGCVDVPPAPLLTCACSRFTATRLTTVRQ